jgi:hypothetical protein
VRENYSHRFSTGIAESRNRKHRIDNDFGITGSKPCSNGMWSPRQNYLLPFTPDRFLHTVWDFAVLGKKACYLKTTNQDFGDIHQGPEIFSIPILLPTTQGTFSD